MLPGSNVDVTVTQADIVPLLIWCADYRARIFSLGSSFEFRPLQHKCRTPMAQYIVDASEQCHDWCERLRAVETVSQRAGKL